MKWHAASPPKIEASRRSRGETAETAVTSEYPPSVQEKEVSGVEKNSRWYPAGYCDQDPSHSSSFAEVRANGNKTSIVANCCCPGDEPRAREPLYS